MSSVAYFKSLTSSVTIEETERYLRSALISHGLTLVKNNSQTLRDMVRGKSFAAVGNLLSATVSNNEEIDSGFFMDMENRVWGTGNQGKSKSQLSGDALKDESLALWIENTRKAEHKLLTKDNQEIYAFVAPVMIKENIAGHIYFGFSTMPMQLELIRLSALVEKNLRHTLLLISALIFFVLAVLFLITERVEKRMMKPLLLLSKAMARISSGDYSTPRIGQTGNETGELIETFEKMQKHIESTQNDLLDSNKKLIKANEKIVIERNELKELNFHLEEKMKERTNTLKSIQQQLLEAARFSGMAEVAINVLHNLGNVLNSVKISNQQTHRLLLNSKVFAFNKTNVMLREHQEDMANFLLHDEKGKLLPGFYLLLDEALIKENGELVENTIRISKSVDSMTEIISAQQEVAKKGVYLEELDMCEIVDDVLNIQENMLLSNNIKTDLQLEKVPLFEGDRSKIHQILNNIIVNAKDAVIGNNIDDRSIWISVFGKDNKITIQVKDNGVGIDGTVLAEVFSHGYTTKKEGHGFGLHSCANYLAEMRGKISVESEGLGMGCCFMIQLPVAKK